MTRYTFTVDGHDDLTAEAESIGGIVDRAHRVALELASDGPVTMTITGPGGEPYPFMYHLDAECLGAEAVEDAIDEMMWNLRAKLHYDADRAAAG